MEYLRWVTSNLVLIPVDFHNNLFRHIGIGVLNGSLWTIPVECSFYVVVPAFYLFAKRYGFGRMIAVVMGVALASHVLVWLCEEAYGRTLVVKILSITFLPHLICFGLGMFWFRWWNYAPKHWVLWLLSLALYTGIRSDLVAGMSILGPVRKFAWAVPLSYAVLWFGHNAPTIFQKLTRIGDLSYGVYIWHVLVINLFLYLGLPAKIRGTGGGNPVIGAVIATTFGIAAISWWLIEKPSLRLKPFTSKQANLPEEGRHVQIQSPIISASEGKADSIKV